jgi:hypothetical protein
VSGRCFPIESSSFLGVNFVVCTSKFLLNERLNGAISLGQIKELHDEPVFD